MESKLEKDLWRCLDMMVPSWPKQTNGMDRLTNYIYYIDDLDRLIKKTEEEGNDLQYVLHRWFNQKTSYECECIFCQYGARHDNDKKNHDVDIWIQDQPFDVKLTRMPRDWCASEVKNARDNRNDLIRNLYRYQTSGKRMQAVQRLYVVCNEGGYYENLRKKLDFRSMSNGIRNYMNYVRDRDYEFNRVDIELPNGDKYERVRTDAIILK